jgi:hypothetical protein
VSNPDGTFSQPSTINQNYDDQTSTMIGGQTTYSSSTQNGVMSADTLEIDASGNITGNEGQSSQQQYVFTDSTGSCYNVLLTAANNVLTGVTNGCQ